MRTRIALAGQAVLALAGLAAGAPAWAGEDIPAAIRRIWEHRAPVYQESFARRLSSGDVYALYDVEAELKNLVRYAGRTRDRAMLDGLAGLFAEAYPHLTLGRDGCRRWIASDPGHPEDAGDEVQLCSIQFLYAATALIDAIAHLAASRRTPRMESFCARFTPVVVHDHYARWLAAFTSSMTRKLNRASHHNYEDAVGDKAMLFVGGAVHVLAAHAADPRAAPLAPGEKKALRDFVALGAALLKSRLVESELRDFAGRPVKGLDFDRGMWDDAPEYAYAGYTGERYPALEDRKAGVNVGWDVSHARRFVDVFDALYDGRRATGQSFPGKKVMRGLANQLAYGAFNGDADRPLFKNFMDGTNGWYRVGYAGRSGSGVPPFQLSDAVATGGYGFWSRFNPEIGRILLGLWRWAHQAEAGQDPVFARYYGRAFFPDQDSWQLLAFLPSIAP